jgi:hypothetical protein
MQAIGKHILLTRKETSQSTLIYIPSSANVYEIVSLGDEIDRTLLAVGNTVHIRGEPGKCDNSGDEPLFYTTYDMVICIDE